MNRATRRTLAKLPRTPRVCGILGGDLRRVPRTRPRIGGNLGGALHGVPRTGPRIGGTLDGVLRGLPITRLRVCRTLGWACGLLIHLFQ
jgi:hypothetical protein